MVQLTMRMRIGSCSKLLLVVFIPGPVDELGAIRSGDLIHKYHSDAGIGFHWFRSGDHRGRATRAIIPIISSS
jgi:hypothetical protein